LAAENRLFRPLVFSQTGEEKMLGQMMHRPLCTTTILSHARTAFPAARIISRGQDKSVSHFDFGQLSGRVAQLANWLVAQAIGVGDRVATLAWNDHRHLELYYAISGIGAVCHTVNPRLPVDNIAYIIEHAEDRLLFVDPGFLPLLPDILAKVKNPPGIVLLSELAGSAAARQAIAAHDLGTYETLIQDQPEAFDWPEFDENTACGICYTSGTTGNPKGVLYSHRSTVLHAMQVAISFSSILREGQRVLSLVPLFHVNAWGLPYTCALVGASPVFAGPHLDGESLFELMQAEQVNSVWGVPTVLTSLLQEIDKRGCLPAGFDNILVGGSAVSASFIEAYEKLGISVNHAWGMTEMNPIGTQGSIAPEMQQLPRAELTRLKLRQGRKIFGIEMKLVDQAGQEIAQDGRQSGELLVRSNTTAAQYYKNPQATAEAFDAEGWFRTGDIANIDATGNLLITDRAKDLIKSGGEWISSLELENIILSHAAIADCAVVAAAHEKWDERPLIVAVPKRNPADYSAADKDALFAELLDLLRQNLPKWQLPDGLVLLDQLPLTATGKISKIKLREQFHTYFSKAE
jgi:acyl-CoA synthetase (AMP-forming)/AMP-acid ligase II